MTGCVVFDLDGTLIDSVQDIQAIANAALEDFDAAPITLEEAREFIGQGVGVFVAKLRRAKNIPETEEPRLLKAYLARYDTAVDLTKPYPGVAEALEQLGTKYRLGICTNKPIRPTMAVLNHLGLDRFFAAVWGGDSDLGRKPDPAPLLAVFEELGGGPSIYVGDSEIDAETARRADIPFLLFTEGYRNCPIDEMQNRATFDDFGALPGLVEQAMR